MYELAIIGGGPAGAAAAIYAARKRLRTVMILEEGGGQSGVSTGIQNWIGTPNISGADLADNLKKHVMEYAGEFLTILSPVRATGLTPKDMSVEVTLSKGEPVVASAVLITTGANRRKLEVPGRPNTTRKDLLTAPHATGRFLRIRTSRSSAAVTRHLKRHCSCSPTARRLRFLTAAKPSRRTKSASPRHSRIRICMW